jgi:predicted transcriptional regulator
VNPIRAPKTVFVIDNEATGKAAKKLRTDAGVQGWILARRMRVSHGQLSKLEMGKAVWTDTLARRFTKALEKIRGMTVKKAYLR